MWAGIREQLSCMVPALEIVAMVLVGLQSSRGLTLRWCTHMAVVISRIFYR